MSTFAQVRGVLFRRPEVKTSAAGKVYAPAVRVSDAVQWWSVIGLTEEVIAELMTLRAGDALAATGPMTASLYESRQGPRVSLSLVAEQVISPRRHKKRREPFQAAASPERPFGDEVAL